MKRKFFILFFGFIVLTAVSCAEENTYSPSKKVINIANVGFKENPPATWITNFPMCEKFLKVEWIDKEKKIGFSKYDIYKNGIRDGHMTALVYLNKHYPHIDYDVYKYEKSNKLSELFTFLEKGKIIGKDRLLNIKYNEKSITFWPTMPVIPVRATIADNKLNVCVVYPSEDLVWLVETKKVGKIYSTQMALDKFNNIKKIFPTMPFKVFMGYTSLDLNFDGEEDYIDQGMFYSFGEKYYRRKKNKSYYKSGKLYIEYIFPPKGNKCVRQYGIDYITSDGKNYFLSNQCNLTSSSRSN